jgi:hypothetical protein
MSPVAGVWTGVLARPHPCVAGSNPTRGTTHSPRKIALGVTDGQQKQHPWHLMVASFTAPCSRALDPHCSRSRPRAGPRNLCESAGPALPWRIIRCSWRRSSPTVPLVAIPPVVNPVVAIPIPPVPTTVLVATVVPVIAVPGPVVSPTVPVMTIPPVVNPVVAIPRPPVPTTGPLPAVVPVIAVVSVRVVHLAGTRCRRL